jgi:Aldo/keto reductase family
MRYKLFGKHTGLRVSELVLGAGTFGTRWGHGAEPDEAGRILNAYAEAGGNFIDTANGYQFGQSEEILGDLLSGRRDDFVLATKFTFQTDPKAGILVTGNGLVGRGECQAAKDRSDRSLLGARVGRSDAGRRDRARLRRSRSNRKDPLRGSFRLPCMAGGGPRPSPNCAASRGSPVFRSSIALSNARPSRSFCRPARPSASVLSLGRR